MLNFLRISLAGRAPGKRSTAGRWTLAVHLKFEHLESRCLLSAAPSSIGELPDLGALTADLHDTLPLTVALRTGASLDLPSRPGLIEPAAPGFPLYLPLKPPADGAGLGKGPELPPMVPSPPPDLPPESSLGPLIDIGNFDANEQVGTLADSVTTKEIHDVLSLLAALQYLPNAEHSEATGFPEIPIEIVRNPAPALAQADPIDPRKQDGGMVALVRDALITELAGEQNDSGHHAPLLGHAIQIEGIYDRFQAFEVSTTEAAAPHPPAPPIDLEATSQPFAPELAAPSHDTESLPAAPNQSGGSPGNIQGGEELSEIACYNIRLPNAIESQTTTIPTL